MENHTREKSIPKNLPPSDDVEFWGEDAEKIVGMRKTIKMKKDHTWRQKGHQAICISCPFEHGIFLRPDQEVRDGKIVKKNLHCQPDGEA